MRYGLFAIALTAFVSFAGSAMAEGCSYGHTKTAQTPAPSTVADSAVQQSTPTGG